MDTTILRAIAANLLVPTVAIVGSALSQTTITEQATLLASDGVFQDSLGASAGLHGDTAILGAFAHAGPGPFGPTSYSGAAYIFVGSDSSWSEEAELLPSAPEVGGAFGVAVAIYEDTAVVGAPGEGPNAAGAVYIFNRAGTSWTQERRITPFDGADSDAFGVSVAIDGNTIVIGSRSDDDNGVSSGSAYVYSYDGTTWGFSQKLTASDGEALDSFGVSVDVFGETIVVGAYGDDDAGAGAGAAYVFNLVMGNWMEGMKLLASDGVAGDGFGGSVGTSCNTIVVSSTNDSGGLAGGAAYVFCASGSTWSQCQKLTASDGFAGQVFGASVAIDGEWIMVGAPEIIDSSAVAGPGSAYLYERDLAAVWNEKAKLVPSTAVANDALGWSVALHRGTALAGAVRFACCPPTGPGAGYIFDGTPDSFRTLCNGDGGDQMGCTNCPCGNNAPRCAIGGCLNSSGFGTRLIASGDASVSLPPGSTADLRFALTRAPANTFSILTSGERAAPNNGFSPCFGKESGIGFIGFDGLRCVLVNTRRHGGRATDSNGEVGMTNNPWGGEGPPPAGIAVAGGGFGAGQTRFFQAIHRDDPLAVCSRGLNTSQAVEVTFTP